MPELFPITGFTTDKRFRIYADDYVFTFLNDPDRENRKPSVPILFNGLREYYDDIKTIDEFIQCETFEGEQLAIHYGDEPLKVFDHLRLRTQCFALGEVAYFEEGQGITSITFAGGTLDSLFFPRSLDMNFTERIKDGVSVDFKDDSISCETVVKDEKIRISVASNFRFGSGADGAEIKNTGNRFTVEFETPKKMTEILKCYRTLRDCMRIMTGRANVGVDTIKYSTNIDTEHSPVPLGGQFYIRDEGEKTSKNAFKNIIFEDLREKLGNLWKLIYTSESSKKEYSIGFIPQSDDEYNVVDNNTIRLLCSALEFETDKEKSIKPENNPPLKELIQQAKQLAKEAYENGEITESTFNCINGEIEHWSFSAKDKITKLFELHRGSMQMMSVQLNVANEYDIGAFVKHRNSITHGSEGIIPPTVGETAILLRGLVYCNILKRIGMSEEEIVGLVERHKVNS